MDIGTVIPFATLKGVAPTIFEQDGIVCAVADFGSEYLGFIVSPDGDEATVSASGWSRNWVGNRICEQAMATALANGLEPEEPQSFCP